MMNSSVVRIKRRPSFGPQSFLAKVGEGRSIGKYRKGNSSFHRETLRMKSSTSKGVRWRSLSSRNRAEKRSWRSWEQMFLGEGCLAGQEKRCAHQW